jgi:transposase-like protein
MMTCPSGFIPVESEVEVSAKGERRRFTAEYKRKILTEADGCSRPGELGALLRREGLYSSHLAAWRRIREQNGLAGLSPKQRGPKAKVADPRDKRIVELERDNRRLKARLERAEALIEVQKKLSQLLGSESPPNNEER